MVVSLAVAPELPPVTISPLVNVPLVLDTDTVGATASVSSAVDS